MEFYKGKKVLIAGGSEGIGLAFAELLSQYDAELVILSRNIEKLKLAQQRASGSQIIACDVTDAAATEKAVNNAIQMLGGLDMVINSAGFARPGYFHELSNQDLRDMMELNYFGSVNVLKPLVPFFMKQRKGWILNTSSIAGFIGLFGYTGYCASKFAVIGFSEALRHELKPFGIRVSVLCPPNTRTPGLVSENKMKPQEVLATEEKVKPVDPEQVAFSTLKQWQKGKDIIVPTFDGTMAYSLKRHLPWVIDSIVKRKSLPDLER